jgi:hypothetical protein
MTITLIIINQYDDYVINVNRHQSASISINQRQSTSIKGRINPHHHTIRHDTIRSRVWSSSSGQRRSTSASTRTHFSSIWFHDTSRRVSDLLLHNNQHQHQHHQQHQHHINNASTPPHQQRINNASQHSNTTV